MIRKTMTMDGNSAAAWVSYFFTDTAAVYPITPSTPMAESVDYMSDSGRRNLFGFPVSLVEMQSEAGAAGAVHGALAAGALASTYTASQGLLLMIPDIYKMAGELLPGVIHTAARCVSSHALSIFGDHSDVYACRQTGAAMLCSSNPQEVMDLGAVAHLSAISGRIPFIHFFDGFRTSHEIRKVEAWGEEELYELLDHEALKNFRDRALNPANPYMRGTAQNPDIFFQNREACNIYYDRLPEIAENYMKKINELLGTDYRLFNYSGAPDAEHIIVAMGSVTDTIEETVEYLNKKGGKYGLIRVRLYRPFSTERFIREIPETVKRITVLDRTKESGAVGEPLFLDVCAALRGSAFCNIPVYSGRYGLASKDTTPGQIAAVFRNTQKPVFTIGITDDVTHLSLETEEEPDTVPEDTMSCKVWGLGSDGTVGANKNTIKIIGDNTDLHVQGYFSYDSKKSGGLTISHLRIGAEPIKSSYLISKADFAACHNQSYINKYDIVSDLKNGGTFLLNTSWSEEELDEKLPAEVKRYIAENNIDFYIIDGFKIAAEAGTGHRINTVLQSAFFSLTNIIPMDKAIEYMINAVKKTYGKKGKNIVESNIKAIEMGHKSIVKVKIPSDWVNAQEKQDNSCQADNDFIKNIQIPCNQQKGDDIPVSALVDYADGVFPLGTAAYEKRGIAPRVPVWIPENCIQCNFCSYVCPHAVIRPFVLTEQEAENVKTVLLKPILNKMRFLVAPSVMDCTGCGLCAGICPADPKALEMKPFEEQKEKQKVFDYAKSLEPKKEVMEKFKAGTIKGSQFRKPLLEFSGACAGCGETPYARLITQLFGEKMFIANATGCSSIWGGSIPSIPYTCGRSGRGPAWANSLFEDNAEFGYGIMLAHNTLHERAVNAVKELAEKTINDNFKTAAENFIENQNDENADIMINTLEKEFNEEAEKIKKYKKYLSKKSHWIFGGDGWAYDIGFGGLDHVIASGANINIFVFDTEIYSNTGGQTSKATPAGAAAQFSPSGKESSKKDLAAMAMSYGNVYTAQIAMGADLNQCIKTIIEAEAYNGPSLIIGYAPCISHGIKGGMSSCMAEQKRAVEAGYWHLFRFNPDLRKQQKNPLIIDSKKPEPEKYREFLSGETRFSITSLKDPENAEKLFEKAEKTAMQKYELLQKISEL